MAFPVVASSNVSNGTTSVSPGVSISMPSGISAGDLLIAFCAGDTDTTFTASGWTSITAQADPDNQAQLTVFAKIAAGSDTMTLVGEANDYAVVTVRITGHAITDVTTILKGTAATTAAGTPTTNPDPPSVTPSSTEDWLFLECFAADDDDDTGSYASTSYTGVAQQQSANSATSCLVAVAYRQLNTGSAENPGQMTMAASEEWIAQTFAIKPNQSRTVTCTTETISIVENTAAINKTRKIIGGVEAVSVATNAAQVNRPRVVTSSTEIISVSTKLATLAPYSTETAYFDGSISITDNDSVWTNDANAFDGSTSTFATTTAAAGSYTVNELAGFGHTSTITYNQIVNAWFRYYITTPSGGLTVSVFNSALTNITPGSASSSEGWQPPTLRSIATNIRDWPYEGWTSGEWDAIGCIAYPNSGTNDCGIAKVELIVDYLVGVSGTIYEANVTGFSDAQSVWTNETFINTSYTASAALASGTTGGSNSNNALILYGTSAPASGPTIYDVYARLGIGGTGAQQYEMHCEVWTSGKGSQLLHHWAPESSSSYQYGPWLRVNAPSGGWTWSAVQNLEFYFYGVNDDSTSTGKAVVAQIKVFAPQTNRNVTGVTEAITVVENNATVNKKRGILGVTEALTVTANAATVRKELKILGTTEVVTVVENNATVSKVRGVACTTEVVTVTENPASVTRGINVIATTEVVSVVENTATVNKKRGVNGVTEIITVIEGTATVNKERGITGTTEVVTVVENPASVALVRNVTGATEQILLTENTATVNKTRNVTGVTEVVTVTENTGLVVTGKGIFCTTEVVTVVENLASINKERGVTGSTEAVLVVENTATVNKKRGVNGITEIITVIENVAVVGKPRNVVGVTEVVVVVENPATVVKGGVLIVTGTTEVVTIAENPASVNKARNVPSVTEVVTVATNAASIASTRYITGITESVLLRTNASTIFILLRDIPDQNPNWTPITSAPDAWTPIVPGQTPGYTTIVPNQAGLWAEGSIVN